MNPVSGSNSSVAQYKDRSSFHDRALFYTAYEIQRFIHSLPPVNPYENSLVERLHASAASSPLRQGALKPRYQTKQGLVLQGKVMRGFNVATAIHTPYGSLPIQSSPELKTLVQPLGLKKPKDVRIFESLGVEGLVAFITRWEDQSIEFPLYRDIDEYVPEKETVRVYQNLKQLMMPTTSRVDQEKLALRSQEEKDQICKEEWLRAERQCKRIFSLKEPLLAKLRDRELHGRINIDSFLEKKRISSIVQNCEKDCN